MRLDPEAFIEQLHKLHLSSKSSGSMQLSMKRFRGAPGKKIRNGLSRFNKEAAAKERQEVAAKGTDESGKCIVRATVKKKKISTIVALEDLPEFHRSLSNIMNVHMDGLRKRGKKAKKPKA